jgi:glycosyltransferase involved in cell wall biosynthesis
LAAAKRNQRFVRLIVAGERDEIENPNEFARIYYIGAKPMKFFGNGFRVMRPRQIKENGARLREILLDEKPDLIEICDKYSLSLLAGSIRSNELSKLGRPVLAQLSCERMDDDLASHFFLRWTSGWLSRSLIRNYEFPLYDYHLANSQYTAEEFFEALDRKKNPRRIASFLNYCWRKRFAARADYRERIIVCPRGINAHVFRANRKTDGARAQIRVRAKIPPNSVVLFYAGRISAEKNIQLLLELMKRLSRDKKVDYRLFVAGEGPYLEKLKKQSARKIPKRIIFLGHLDKELLADYYANVDIFVHPNPHEPFGIAPLEAMASGVPVIAPNSGGILSYANKENAWLVEPKVEAFIAAIKEIAKDPVLREAKIKRALAVANANTREKATDNLFAIYDNLLADFNGRKDLFVNREASKKFDFVKELKL